MSELRILDGALVSDGVNTYAIDKLVQIDYTNYRGERGMVIVAITNVVPMTFGSNEYHTENQWLLHAYNVRRKVFRTYAMKDIHAWYPIPIDRALNILKTLHEGKTDGED